VGNSANIPDVFIVSLLEVIQLQHGGVFAIVYRDEKRLEGIFATRGNKTFSLGDMHGRARYVTAQNTYSNPSVSYPVQNV